MVSREGHTVVDSCRDQRVSLRGMGMMLGIVLSICVVLWPAGASADPIGAPFSEYTATVSTDQAGGHPDMTVKFKLGTRLEPIQACGCNQAKNILVETPAGFIGNPHAVPQCSIAQFV